MTAIKDLLRRNPQIFKLLKLFFLYIKYLRSFKGLFKRRIKELPVFEIAIDKAHCFFGYYDKSPWNISMSHMLFNSVSKDDLQTLSVNIYDLKSNSFRTLDKTQAWNWQQGVMLQWISDSEIIYNVIVNGELRSKIFNMISNEYVVLNSPIYAVGKVSHNALALNFNRLNLYAKGYGYELGGSPILSDSNDGIWRFDIKENNEAELLITIDEVVKFRFKKEFEGAQHYLNHVEYCSNDESFIFIHRWFKNSDPFKSRLLMFNLETRELSLLLDNEHVSHFCWKNSDELLIYATNDKKDKGYFTIDINTLRQSEIFINMPKVDGHPSYEPGGELILTDTYPDDSRIQSLFIFNPQSDELKKINEVYSPFKYYDENRCDLHPRWSPDGNYIALDTTYSGFRRVSVINI